MTYVPAKGPDNAQIVLVGEAPGATEEAQQEPFVGSSGNLLRSVLRQNGINDNEIFLTNLVKYRPPGNQIGKFLKLTSRKGVNEKTKFQVLDDRVQEGITELFGELARIKPNVIVPVGNAALWALTGLTRIQKRRGSIMEVTWDGPRAEAFDLPPDVVNVVIGTKVYPTYHPAYILRMMHLLPIFQYDIGQVLKESRFAECNIPEPRIEIDPSGASLEAWATKLTTGQLVSYDIEVIGGDTLFCCGFAVDEHEVVTLTPTDPARFDVIKSVLESPDIPKLAQNGIFDATWLKRFSGITVNGDRHDTLVAHSVIYPEFPKGLDFIGSLYTRFPYHKDEGKSWNPRDAADTKRFLEYNAKDVVVTLAAYQAMLEDELANPETQRTYRRIMDQQVVYEDMVNNGIQLDTATLADLRLEYKEGAKKIQAELDEAVARELTKQILASRDSKRTEMLRAFKETFDKGRGTSKGGLNVNSPKQLKEWLYDILKLPPQTNRGTKKLTTNETALKTLYAKTKDETLLKIWYIREKRKRVSSFLSPTLTNDGRMYFSVMPVKTKTGRSACGKTILGEGLNLQTVPHELRHVYVPDDPAFELAYLDLGQAEARVVAYAGGISRMIEAFETGEDLHKLTASLILDIPFDEVEEYPHRYLGKRCNHAFNYEMGPYKFYDVVNDDATKTGIAITRPEAKKLRAAHLRAYPELRFYWDWIRGELRRNRTITNPFGRARAFYGRLNDQTFREAFSHYAQSTVADVLRTGMLRVHEFLPSVDPRARVLLEVHDAILIQYPKEARDHALTEAMKLMKVPIVVKGHPVTIPTDAQYGPNWHDLENYDGGE